MAHSFSSFKACSWPLVAAVLMAATQMPSLAEAQTVAGGKNSKTVILPTDTEHNPDDPVTKGPPPAGPAAIDDSRQLPTGAPEIADRMPTSTEDFDNLLKVLRSRIAALENQQQRSELPVGQLARNLEEARRDVERMAELLLRKEITEVRQRSEVLLSQRRVESLTAQLDGTQGELESLRGERDRLDSLVAESTSRVEELAGQLLSLDEERNKLTSMLNGSREEARQAREQLEKADQRVADINVEMRDLIARNEKEEKRYQQRVAEAQASMTLLEQRLQDDRTRFEDELRQREQQVAMMQNQQKNVRAVLEQALEEIKQVTIEQSASDYEKEMIRAADASDHARRELLGNLGFRRDHNGALQMPDIDVAGLATREEDIEPAAGADPACPNMSKPVKRTYLAGQDAEEWKHYLIGTLRFGEARTRIDQAQLSSIADCMASLGRSPGYYFKIVGHTDSLGAAPYNEELSLERAQVARDLFLQKVAIQPWRLFAQGRGEKFPLASNGDNQGRAMNRRVEIFAVKAPN
ncbi:MAG: OmpA family protein [Geminicoccaceae bacterium]|nr:OmpA family protein [Geminicoccaceae bacterium]